MPDMARTMECARTANDLGPLPTGTVALLFTDNEGSTRLLHAHPQEYGPALVRHHALLREAVEAHRGQVVETEGDAVFAVFARPSDAVVAAIAAQRALGAQDWDAVGRVRVRMGLHLGEVELYGRQYVGTAVHRAARVAGAAHGDQVVLSEAAAVHMRDSLPDGAGLKDLGEHRLKSLARPEHVWQLTHAALPSDFPPLRSLDRHPNNLPAQLTSFVGRQHELTEVIQRLMEARLLTLAGPGGTGKTRLALHAAAQSVDRYADGAWLVELAAVAEPDHVARAVGAVFDIRDAPGRTLLEALEDTLRTKQTLLLLDNCEHVIAACAALADRLLRGCPQLTILATSREPLGIGGEIVWRVPSLSVPPASEVVDQDSLTQYEATTLFVERAKAVSSDFASTAGNALPIAQICRRLDGIPLAIELAAARVHVLPPEQLLERLEDRFRLLTGGSRTALERHQTLQAAIEWSYALLSGPERIVFGGLSVFVGGWTLAAAEGVCAGGGIEQRDVLDLLTHLVDKSLVIADGSADATARYRLLETIRQFGRLKLLATDEVDEAHQRHVAWFTQLAERRDLPHPERRFDILEREQDNFRAALRWLIDRRSGSAALRLVVQVAHLFYTRGSIAEALAWLEDVAPLPGAREPAALRVEALYRASGCAVYLGDLGAAQRYGEECLAVARWDGDVRAEANALSRLGLVARAAGDAAGARDFQERALGLCQSLGDEAGMALFLGRLASAVVMVGEVAEGERLHEEALDRQLRVKNEFGAAWSLLALGRLALDRGDLERAQARFTECLSHIREQGTRVVQAYALEGVAELAAAGGHAERGLCLLSVADGLRAASGTMPLRQELPRLERLRAALRGALDDSAAEAARRTGRSMTLDQAIAYALEVHAERVRV